MIKGWERQEASQLCGILGGWQAKKGIVAYQPGMPKLTQEMQSRLLSDYVAGTMTVQAIAHKYGVHPSYPGQLARRRGLPLREKCTRNRSIAAYNRKR